ncbi:hypothetical protein F6P56_07005 [Streptococcus suis]|uniref:hypothetical protein n=1 Tax=Streptococcus suis TaxID=1307 RepID=UPI001EE7C1EA|nr:hypothetical protein [Streptococcus suis]MBS8038123.1 hypothetical protein [Streptococcus suis]MBS8050266.1 hypothetical protein [Streptococcus suis]
MNKQESKFQKGIKIYRRVSLVVGLIFTAAILVFSWMVKSGMDVGQHPTRPSTTASSIVVEEQTTEEEVTKTTQSAEGVVGSDGVFQEKGKRYLYTYTLEDKILGVVESDGLAVEIVSWGDVKPEEFDKILNSSRTVREFQREWNAE